MNKIIITDKPEAFEGKFTGVKIVNTTDFKKEAPVSWPNYEYEFTPYLICENIKGANPIIAIDFSIQETDKYLIAHHIITSLKSFVFFFSETVVTELLYENDLGLFRNKFIRVIPFKNLIEYFNNDSELERLNQIYNLDFDYAKYKSAFQKYLSFDRHQATNEWGATKLLLNHGVPLSDIESQYQLPKTIYFKQKLKEHNIDSSTIIGITRYSKADLNAEKTKFLSNKQKVNKILLIDDNSNRGWGYALKILFNSSPDIKLNYEEANSIVDFSIYDMIFLDLRLPSNLNDTIPKIDNGFKLIHKIKADESSLHIPLIIFTASQKASTLNDILEAGADAMYVKESPELTTSESLDNYGDFISEINFQIEKGEHLKKYWKAIQQIKGELLPEIIDSGTLKLKSRIIERLEMFYGLIKKKYEQSSYNDAKFHFSSDILSFITLWSILNEVQESYYEKVFTKLKTVDNINNNKYSLKNPDGSLVEVFRGLKIKAQSEYYSENSSYYLNFSRNGIAFFDTDNSQYGVYNVGANISCYLHPTTNSFETTRDMQNRLVSNTKFKGDPNQKLSFQIAFLLLEKSRLKASTKLNDYLRMLKTANEQRNRLYITHGEYASTNFHAQLERDKNLPLNATIDLFKLVTFLLTGNDSII